jgi:UDP-N-acetylmuramyl pentapeptide synthase
LAWPALQASVRGYKSLPMRWQRSTVAGLEIVNDAYNANPVSMRAALDAFAGEGNRWLVLGGMFELGARSEQEHLDLGRTVARGVWAGLITVGELGALIARGALEEGFSRDRVRECRTHEEAAEYLRACARPGESVLLKGSRGEHLERMIDALTL